MEKGTTIKISEDGKTWSHEMSMKEFISNYTDKKIKKFIVTEPLTIQDIYAIVRDEDGVTVCGITECDNY